MESGDQDPIDVRGPKFLVRRQLREAQGGVAQRYHWHLFFLPGDLRGAEQPRPAIYDPTILSNLNAPMWATGVANE